MDNNPISFSLIGAVDNGKSTCAGAILAETDLVSARELESLKQQYKGQKTESWYLAFLVDVYEEERKRGKTIEHAKIPFSLNGFNYILYDTPGHATYAREIPVALQHSAVAVFIYSVDCHADVGDKLSMVRGCGITQLVVVINKMDKVDWDVDMYVSSTQRMRAMIKKYIPKYKSMTIVFVPISAYKRMGIINKSGMPSWYKGKCLMDLVSSFHAIDASTMSTELLKEIKISLEIFPTYSGIICNGTNVIVYSNGNEYDGVVVKMNKTFAKKCDTIMCQIKLRQASNINMVNSIMIRKSDHTIGRGVIVRAGSE